MTHSKGPRVGTRVRFEPTPVSLALYTQAPQPGSEGSVVPMPGFPKQTFMPGPGGGLVYVRWDDGDVLGVSPNDLKPLKGASKGGARTKIPGSAAFAEELYKKLSHLGRIVRVRHQHMGAVDAVYVNFINLPLGTGDGSGAEAENNRMSFWIHGFDKHDANAPPASGKVKIDMANSALPRAYKLRAKTGTPDQIAAYLVAFLSKVVAEVPPHFTHTRQGNPTAKAPAANEKQAVCLALLTRPHGGEGPWLAPVAIETWHEVLRNGWAVDGVESSIDGTASGRAITSAGMEALLSSKTYGKAAHTAIASHTDAGTYGELESKYREEALRAVANGYKPKGRRRNPAGDELTCSRCGGSPTQPNGCPLCCRDCGYPCGYEKDGEGFHAETETRAARKGPKAKRKTKGREPPQMTAVLGPPVQRSKMRGRAENPASPDYERVGIAWTAPRGPSKRQGEYGIYRRPGSTELSARYEGHREGDWRTGLPSRGPNAYHMQVRIPFEPSHFVETRFFADGARQGNPLKHTGGGCFLPDGPCDDTFEDTSRGHSTSIEVITESPEEHFRLGNPTTIILGKDRLGNEYHVGSWKPMYSTDEKWVVTTVSPDGHVKSVDDRKGKYVAYTEKSDAELFGRALMKGRTESDAKALVAAAQAKRGLVKHGKALGGVLGRLGASALKHGKAAAGHAAKKAKEKAKELHAKHQAAAKKKKGGRKGNPASRFVSLEPDSANAKAWWASHDDAMLLSIMNYAHSRTGAGDNLGVEAHTLAEGAWEARRRGYEPVLDGSPPRIVLAVTGTAGARQKNPKRVKVASKRGQGPLVHEAIRPMARQLTQGRACYVAECFEPAPGPKLLPPRSR